MHRNIEIHELYGEIPSYLRGLFEGIRYPWELLPKLCAYMEDLVQKIPHGFFLWREGILLGEDVRISENAVIIPPAIIGRGSEIRTGAYLRGYVIAGEGCVIGNSSELKH